MSSAIPVPTRLWRVAGALALVHVVLMLGGNSQVLALSSTRPAPGAPDAEGLTAREREVLERIADGASNAQIARALGISVKTVQNYVSRILDKLQVTDRTQAALRAREGRRS